MFDHQSMTLKKTLLLRYLDKNTDDIMMYKLRIHVITEASSKASMCKHNWIKNVLYYVITKLISSNMIITFIKFR